MTSPGWHGAATRNVPPAVPAASSEQDRGQPPTAFDRRFVSRSPRLEQLHQLLARAVVVPFAVAPDDLEEMLERLPAPPLGIERNRQVKTSLVVERIGTKFLLELGERTERGRLLRQLERGPRRRDRCILSLGIRNQRQRLARLLDRPGLHITAGKPGKRVDIARVLGQHLGVKLGCGRGVAVDERCVRLLEQILLLSADAILDEVLSPPWTSDWLTPAGREKLRAFGIAPPAARVASPRQLMGSPAVSCPRCGSRDTERVSEFGSTPCKAHYRCGACGEPFDYFKCL